MLQLEADIGPAAVDALTPTWFQVVRTCRETSNTFTLDLERDGRGLDFIPGQFTMLYVFGVGEIPISISGDPHRSDLLVHTIREAGSISKAIGLLRRGAALGVRGPYGTGWPMAEARGRDVLILAGGIGLAPLRPVIYEMLRQRDDFGRVIILYGARTPDDLLYRDQIREWRARLDIELGVTVDRGGGRWRGNVGVVTSLVGAARFDAPNAIAMICGPEIMMDFGVRALLENGLTPRQIYLSMERNMKCAVGYCGHCQYAGSFVCKDGPVYRYDRVAAHFHQREV